MNIKFEIKSDLVLHFLLSPIYFPNNKLTNKWKEYMQEEFFKKNFEQFEELLNAYRG